MLYAAPSPQRKRETSTKENKLRLFLKRSSEPLLNLQNAAQQVGKRIFIYLFIILFLSYLFLKKSLFVQVLYFALFKLIQLSMANICKQLIPIQNSYNIIHVQYIL